MTWPSSSAPWCVASSSAPQILALPRFAWLIPTRPAILHMTFHISCFDAVKWIKLGMQLVLIEVHAAWAFIYSLINSRWQQNNVWSPSTACSQQCIIYYSACIHSFTNREHAINIYCEQCTTLSAKIGCAGLGATDHIAELGSHVNPTSAPFCHISIFPHLVQDRRHGSRCWARGPFVLKSFQNECICENLSQKRSKANKSAIWLINTGNWGHFDLLVNLS